MNTSFDPNLASQLTELPIFSKVLLWLVYRDQKPMASIILDFNWEEDENAQLQVKSWLLSAGILYSPSILAKNTLNISKNEQILINNSKCQLQEDYGSHLLRGLYYGFPVDAVKVFSTESVDGNMWYPSQRLVHAPMVSGLEEQYWYPYIEYVLRRGYELEDSQTAKRWADVVRADIPKLAAQYEKDQIKGFAELKTALM